MEQHFILTDIAGDYTTLKNIQNGEVFEIALALLPDGVDIGTKLTLSGCEWTVEQ